MWYRICNNSIDELNNLDFTEDPGNIDAQPVSLDVSPDVAEKTQQFAKRGNPIVFRANNGQRYLIIHGTPEGYFYTGDSSLNTDDANPTNDGFVSREQLGGWLTAKGLAGTVNVIACYGGRMEPLNFSSGNARSYFRNKGPIALQTYQHPTGQNRLVFQNA